MTSGKGRSKDFLSLLLFNFRLEQLPPVIPGAAAPGGHRAVRRAVARRVERQHRGRVPRVEAFDLHRRRRLDRLVDGSRQRMSERGASGTAKQQGAQRRARRSRFMRRRYHGPRAEPTTAPVPGRRQGFGGSFMGGRCPVSRPSTLFLHKPAALGSVVGSTQKASDLSGRAPPMAVTREPSERDFISRWA